MKFGSKAAALLAAFPCAQSFVVNQKATLVPLRIRNATPFSSNLMTSSSAVNTSSSTEASNPSTSGDSGLDPVFSGALTQVQGALKAAVETPSMQAALDHFAEEYFTASYNSMKAGNEDVTAESTAQNILNAMQYGMQYGIQDKYTFGVTHKALRGDPELEDGNTVDFYKFGCEFFKPTMDLEKSLALGDKNLQKAKEQMANGENVIFFANHQSEADPQVMSMLLQTSGFEGIAEDLTYVAGHKVTTDSLAIPFSMGRNLICIHSKKHIDADPDTKPVKMRQNLSAMSGMLNMLKKGGSCIWVAPSGGRDRRVLDGSRDVPPAPFDQKTIDMFRLMGNKSKVPTHYYSLSMVSYDLCPPPDSVEAGTGEQRNFRFSPIGIYCSEELENVGGVETRHLFTEHAMETCEKNYRTLLSEMSNLQ